MSFDARPYLKEIARGRHAARDLTREQAREVFDAMLAAEVDEVALGAILVAWRVKGESLDELRGMLDAVAAHVRPMRLPARRAMPVLVPTYNGARKMPNVVPLLVLLLAREGVPVLLHGAHQEPQRVGTFEVLAELGYRPATTVEEAEVMLEDQLVAPLPIELLSADLARILALRARTGVRNCAHTVAKLLLPQGTSPQAACRLVAVTHPDFQKLMRDLLVAENGNAFLMRGLEGEATVRLHSPQPIEQVALDGGIVTHLMGDGEPELLLPERDATATAQWTREVLEGRLAVPAALARQAALIAGHCRNALARPALRLVK
jgi:anthranilate phosphoribosyltransferase